ncbi:HpaII family restriction endonuclease [Phocaeicola plebeius]|uniref:HpaII family restriction endonuclease n=1 Tax=Phocaeicola plebeius TaxID=310297 RepID=UPI00307E01FF
MALTGNKGEWSEIYTLLKLLGEGKVYAGDQNLNKIQDLFYPIIMILRQEKDGNYNYRLQDKDVVIQTPAGEELLRIPASVFLVEAENLLKAINENDGAFGVPQIEVFMNSIYCHAEFNLQMQQNSD